MLAESALCLANDALAKATGQVTTAVAMGTRCAHGCSELASRSGAPQRLAS